MTATQYLYARNGALRANPTNDAVDIHITEHGSDWLWAVFSIFALLSTIHALLYAMARKSGFKKLLFLYPLIICAINTVVYFTYASNLGYAGAPVEFNNVTTSVGLGVRPIFYVRFIMWFLSWPFVLTIFEFSTHTLDYNSAEETLVHKIISLFQGLVIKSICTEVFVLGLLAGTLIESTYKWGYYAIAVAAQLFAMTLVFCDAWKYFRNGTGNRTAQLLIFCQLPVWICYPIAWGLSEGGNTITPDSEAVFYGILDLCTFGFLPALLTTINVRTIDSGFFASFLHVHQPHSDAEKLVGETPRHSGDTAVHGATRLTESVDKSVSDEAGAV